MSTTCPTTDKIYQFAKLIADVTALFKEIK